MIVAGSANPLLLASAGGYNLTNSARLRSSASAYLNRTPATTTNRKTWTWSAWVKRGELSRRQWLFQQSDTAGDRQIQLEINAGNAIRFGWYDVGVGSGFIITNALYRDPSAWYHIMYSVDTTQATDTNRVKIYVNGSQVTSLDGGSTYPPQNFDTSVNTTNPMSLGASITPSLFFDGYLTEVNFIDGQQLTPSSFGANNASTGVWQPKKYAGTYGTNGFYLPMNVQVQDYSIDYLIVAGGGSGAAGGGGAGGAGGMITGTTSIIDGVSYTVTVGAGGAQTSSTFSQRGNSGSNSVFNSLTGVGGGGGGANDVTNEWDGLSGGSGGGGGSAGSIGAGGAATSGQGNAGGAGGTDFASWRNGGGGGGKGAVGGAVVTATVGGNGGNGGASSITGSSITYAGGGGGGGGGSGTGGTGGTGGGGNGTNGSTTGVAGTANLGGGGGGGGYPAAGGAGGSGVVILRILTSNYSGVTTGSPTVTTDGSYTVVKYTSSGSYTA